MTRAKTISFPRPPQWLRRARVSSPRGRLWSNFCSIPWRFRLPSPEPFPSLWNCKLRVYTSIAKPPSPGLCIKNENIFLVKGLDRDM